MSMEEAIFWGQYALLHVGLLSGPILLSALVVGVIISLLQAVTQVHEMTLVFIPKLIAVFLAILLMGGWMLDRFVFLGTTCFESAAEWHR